MSYNKTRCPSCRGTNATDHGSKVWCHDCQEVFGSKALESFTEAEQRGYARGVAAALKVTRDHADKSAKQCEQLIAARAKLGSIAASREDIASASGQHFAASEIAAGVNALIPGAK